MPIASADQLVSLILETIAADGKISGGDRVVLLVNGLGSTPPMEISIVARAAIQELEKRSVVVERAWAGTFLSALDMPGFSLSVMQVNDHKLKLIDTATDATAWPRGGAINRKRVLLSAVVQEDSPSHATMTEAGARLFKTAHSIARALIVAEPHLADLDSVTGDGDLGASMKRGSEAVLALPVEKFGTVSDGMMAMANAMRKAIGGSSGPFYATGLMRASLHLSGAGAPTARQMAEAFVSAVEAVSELGGANPGDRTMIDALHPAATTFRDRLAGGMNAQAAWQAAVQAGLAGAEATKAMKPRLGRASYLGDRVVGHPDGGAVAVGIWLAAIG
jgi:dihydroxyacetone kinase